jgi:hypothetical protein
MPQGWIVHLVQVGHSSEPHPGIDFSRWASYGNICRIQHEWYPGGTLPPPGGQWLGFVNRVRTLVQNSTGCDKWIIGNEPNVSIEWPGDFKLWPHYVGTLFGRCASEIHALPGHENDEVLVPPIGPWNVEIGESWIWYFETLIPYCTGLGGFALHTYSRGSDPASITSEAKMEPPYDAYYNGFRTYRDWLDIIPQMDSDLPIYITETNQNAAWLDENNGWVQEAYKEIDDWNKSGGQIVRALCLYRWPQYDDYYIQGKNNVLRDFYAAQEHGYTWEQQPPPVGRTIEVSATLMVDGQPDGTFRGTLEEIE